MKISKPKAGIWLARAFLAAAAVAGTPASAYEGAQTSAKPQSGHKKAPPPVIRLPSTLIDPALKDPRTLDNIRVYRLQFPDRAACTHFYKDNIVPHASGGGGPCSSGAVMGVAVPDNSDGGGLADNRYMLTDYFTMQVEKSRALLPPPRVPASGGFSTRFYWQDFIFDHEVGHTLDDGRAGHQMDNFADAYALIRHYQRHGTDTGFDEALIRHRGRLAGFMDGRYAQDHLTSSVLRHIAQAKDKAALIRLTPRQTVRAAGEAVRAAALTSEQLHYLDDASREEQARMHCDPGGFSSPAHYTIAFANRLAADNRVPRSIILSWLDGVRALHASDDPGFTLVSAAHDAAAASQPLPAPPRPTGGAAEYFDPSVTDEAVRQNIGDFRRQFPEYAAGLRFQQDFDAAYYGEGNRRAGVPCGNGVRLVSVVVPPATSSYGESFSRRVLTQSVSIYGIHLPPPRMPAVPAFANDAYWRDFAFDFETGRVLHDLRGEDPGGERDGERDIARRRGRNYFADAYALIRHYQRHGADSGFGDALTAHRGRLAGLDYEFGADEHLSVTILRHIQAMDKEALAALTPQQTIIAAESAARGAALTMAQVDAILVAGNNVRFDMRQPLDAQFGISDKGRIDFSPVHYPLALAARLQKDSLPRAVVAAWLDGIQALHDFNAEERALLLAARDDAAAGRPVPAPPAPIRYGPYEDLPLLAKPASPRPSGR